MPPVPLGSHGSDGSLGPLPVPGTQVGRSLDGRREQENGLDKAWLLPATTHACIVHPPQPQSPVPSLRSWGRGHQPASTGCQPGSSPVATLEPCSFSLTQVLGLILKQPLPAVTHPITTGSKSTPEIFPQVAPQFPQEGGFSILGGCCVTTGKVDTSNLSL